jgi:hypothetical protein
VTNPRNSHGQAPTATLPTTDAAGHGLEVRTVVPQSSTVKTSAGIVAVSASAGPIGLAGARTTTSQPSSSAGSNRALVSGQSAGCPIEGGP